MKLNKFMEVQLNSIIPKSDFEFPAVIASILVSFSVFGQEGGIIGGAVRDFVLHREIRDYDVYIKAKDLGEDFREVLIHAKRFGYTIWDVSKNTEYEDASILAVYKLKKMGYTDVDIILGRDNLPDHVNAFTCDLSKIWYDVLQGKIVLTDEFTKTVRSKTCAICNNRGTHPDVIEEYVDKIQKKYPEYKFVRE